jgi:hypothetical protein
MTKRERELEKLYGEVDDLILRYMNLHTDLFDVDGFFAHIVQFDKFDLCARIEFGQIDFVSFEMIKDKKDKYIYKLPMFKIDGTIKNALRVLRNRLGRRVQTKYILRRIKNEIYKDILEDV